MDKYADGWLTVMQHYHDGGQVLVERMNKDASSSASDAEVKKTLAKDLGDIADFMEKIGREQDALQPPQQFEKLHKLCSTYFHGQAPLWKALASAREKGDAKQATAAQNMITEFMLSQTKAITDEMTRLGHDASRMRDKFKALGG